jgi:hypothetical protein
MLQVQSHLLEPFLLSKENETELSRKEREIMIKYEGLFLNWYFYLNWQNEAWTYSCCQIYFIMSHERVTVYMHK